VLGTYASFALILAASALLGQAVFAACGRRDWSWLAPAVGLGLLCALAWGTVRLPGEGTAALAAILVAAGASLWYLRGRITGVSEAARIGLPVALLGLLAASLPFLVEGRFGILGTGLNPDMSQHLFAADRLAAAGTERLLQSGYPLGPHALVVAVSKGTGASLVHVFDGLSLAIAVAAVLAPLAILGRLAPWRRMVVALLAGLPYLIASYLIQGSFKETMEALMVLAFAIGLHQVDRGELIGGMGERRSLGALPLAALAIGAVYAYSFPGLFWLAGGAALWALLVRPRGLLKPAAVALGALALAVAPEVGRMIDFASFETFDPSGSGLGNLFNRISPLEALGIWPSGDFRLDPGDGAVPAIGYYLGEVLALAALAYGLAWWIRRRELAVPAALATAAVLILYALVSGTAYQEGKAIAIAAPLAMLIAARALLSGEPLVRVSGVRRGLAPMRGRRVDLQAQLAGPLQAALALAFCLAAAACSVLALVNGPVGPSSWFPALTELRHSLGHDSTLVLASPELLDEEHGRDFLFWELRGGRVCVEPARAPSAQPPPAGVAHVITRGAAEPPFADLHPDTSAGPYRVWARRPAPSGPGPCPLLATGARATGARANPAGD
jgi:hypothetical protein